MPRGLDREVQLAFPDGGSKRLDRVDWANGRIYEIKPNTPAEIVKGQRQAATYDLAAAAALVGQ